MKRVGISDPEWISEEGTDSERSILSIPDPELIGTAGIDIGDDGVPHVGMLEPHAHDLRLDSGIPKSLYHFDGVREAIIGLFPCVGRDVDRRCRTSAKKG